MPDHDLAIHEIFGATERDEANFDHIQVGGSRGGRRL
jgi:hypothetical protein